MASDPGRSKRIKLPDHVYKRLVLFNTAMLFVIVLAGVLLVSLRRERAAEIVRSWIDRDTASSHVLEALNSDAAASLDYPAFELRIDSPEMRQIQVQTQQLVEAGIMTDELVSWFPARFFHDGVEYKVKVRLRGDLSSHWENQKKSWRVRFPKEQLFEGRRVLDLVVPDDKGFEVEKVAYDAARELGLLVPDAGFANLRINGVDFGAYFWLEKYGPEMLEKQGYAAGEIFHNQDLWTQTRFNGFGVNVDEFTSSSTNTVHDALAPDPYAGRWDKLVTLAREADDEVFRREIPHLVHVEKFVKWNALTWLFGSLHAHGPDNLRWYYDNSSGLFEPILYDVYRYPLRLPPASDTEIPRWRFESSENSLLTRRIIQIPQYRQRRNEVLWQLVTEPEFDVARLCHAYFTMLRTHLLRGVGSWDSSEIDKFHTETVSILADNRKDLREHLAFARLFVTPAATFEGDQATVKLRLLPDCRSFIGVDRMRLTIAPAIAEQIDAGAIEVSLKDLDGHVHKLDPVETPILEGKALTLVFRDLDIWTPVDPRLAQYPGEWRLDINLGNVQPLGATADLLADVDVEARNSVTGQAIEADQMIAAPIIAGGDPLEPSPAVRRIDEFLAASNLPWQVQDNRLTLPGGRYSIAGIVTVPFGFGLQLAAGTTLEMGPDASIICYGPLMVAGTPEQPVRITPAEEGRTWGTLAVVRAGETSRIRHLEVAGGSECLAQGLFLSGQFCCYWSDVEFEGCTFRDARADDACNVKRASLSMTNCLYYDNFGDGLDADFCEGTVESCLFSDNGGDGVDTSGSRLLVRDCLFERMGDKGISVGEKSDVLAFNNVIRDCVIGVASKDLSHTTLYASVLRDNQTGFALYRKKQLFGGGRGTALGVLFWNNGRQTDLDGESQLDVRGSAADRWESTGSVATAGVQTGDPQPLYETDTDPEILRSGRSAGESPFTVTVSTGGTTHNGFTPPDLRGKPVGLVEPLKLPERP